MNYRADYQGRDGRWRYCRNGLHRAWMNTPEECCNSFAANALRNRNAPCYTKADDCRDDSCQAHEHRRHTRLRWRRD